MTTLAEPEWDQQTRDLALALDAVPKCPICGRDPKVCQAAENEGMFKVDDPIRCHAETALQQRIKAIKDGDHEVPEALLFPMRLLRLDTPPTNQPGEPGPTR